MATAANDGADHSGLDAMTPWFKKELRLQSIIKREMARKAVELVAQAEITEAPTDQLAAKEALKRLENCCGTTEAASLIKEIFVAIDILMREDCPN